MRTGWISFIFLLISGCSYFMAGTWDDDPNNWERAFYIVKPEDVVVIHSKYTRFPHWSDEYIYFFEIDRNDSLFNHFVRELRLGKMIVGSKNFIEAMQAIGERAPSWFLPKMMKKYEVWTPKDFYRDDFRLFLDTDNNSVFIFNQQL